MMKEIINMEEEQNRLIEVCRFTWEMKAASEVWSFERDIYDWYMQQRPKCRSVYLPLFWMAIWRVAHRYPDDAVSELAVGISNIYNSLNSQIHYHTVASEVHCNNQSFPPLPPNVHVYGPGYNYGEDEGITCHEIPLLPFFQKVTFNRKRDIFCSYFITGEYRCRKELNRFLYGREGSCHDDFVVSFRVPFLIYCELLSRSVFVLTPRGTNIAVYRLYEAIQYGAIPVYISDKYSLPYSDEVDWNRLAVLIHPNDIAKIPAVLRRISPEQIQKMQAYGKWFMRNYINLEKLFKRIFQHADRISRL